VTTAKERLEQWYDAHSHDPALADDFNLALAAYKLGCADERKAIVEWLRKQARADGFAAMFAEEIALGDHEDQKP